MAKDSVHTVVPGISAGCMGAVSKSARTSAQSDDFGKILSKSSDSSEKYKMNPKSENVERKDIKSDGYSKGMSSDKAVADKLKKEQKADNIVSESEQNVSKTDVVSKIADKLKEEIAEELDITIEELENIMCQMGLTVVDLFDTNNLSALVVEVNGLSGPEQIISDVEAFGVLKSMIADMTEAVVALDSAGITIEDLDFTDKVTDEVMVTEVKTDGQTENVISDAEVLDIDANESKDSQMIQNDSQTVHITDKTEITENNNSQETTSFLVQETPEAEENPQDGEQDAMEAQTQVQEITIEEENETESQNEGSKQNEGSNHHEERRNHTDRSFNDAVNIQTDNSFNPVDSIRQILTDRVGRTEAYSIIEQITEQIKLTATEELDSIELQLYPAHLGKVSIQIVAKEGVMTAQIAAENEAVKRVIEAQVTMLKENLNNQGLKVENVEVTIASHSFEENNMNQNDEAGEQQKNRKSGRFLREVMDENQETTDMDEPELMATRGNTVSYMA